jgi:PAS domain S-box-containing protein
VASREHRLADLIDVVRVQRMCETLSAASGIALAVLDVDGGVLVAAGWQDICTKFHREHPETVRHCLESDLLINQHLMSFNGEPVPYAYRCANGLWDVAHPLIVDGEHLANVFTGQFFFDDEDIDEAAFRERARGLDFDEAAYMEALARVPVVSHARAELMIAVVTDLVGTLGELGLAGLRQHRAEAALRESEARYRGLAEDMPVYVSTFAADGTLTFVNRWLAAMADADAKTLVGTNMLEFIPPEEREPVQQALAALDPEHPVETHEQTHISADGATHWQQWTNRAIYDAEGGVLRYQAVGQDITDRKHAEQAIADSRRLYEIFLNATDDLGFLKDAALHYVLVNAANARYFGLPVADIVGRDDSELMTPDAAASCRSTDLAALEQQRLIVSCEEVGGRVYESRKFPVALPDGGVGVGGYVRDITDQRTAEDRIARLNTDLELLVAARTAELEAANRELESFSSRCLTTCAPRCAASTASARSSSRTTQNNSTRRGAATLRASALRTRRWL